MISIRGSTVGINPVLSDLTTPRTSKLGKRYFEAHKIDKNELQIRKNFSPILNTPRLPPDDWPDSLDHLVIGLVANRYTKLEKQVKICYLVRGYPI